MLLPDLRKAVLDANLELVRKGLVLFTFGNASAISRKKSLVVIKPSRVAYDQLRPADPVITDLNGKIVDCKLRPSSDLPTHLMAYFTFGINQQDAAIGRFLHDQHYLRKRGQAASYGQPREKK
jgi:L-ribulose-5-phosphate 4-epimerase